MIRIRSWQPAIVGRRQRSRTRGVWSGVLTVHASSGKLSRSLGVVRCHQTEWCGYQWRHQALAVLAALQAKSHRSRGVEGLQVAGENRLLVPFWCQSLPTFACGVNMMCSCRIPKADTYLYGNVVLVMQTSYSFLHLCIPRRIDAAKRLAAWESRESLPSTYDCFRPCSPHNERYTCTPQFRTGLCCAVLYCACITCCCCKYKFCHNSHVLAGDPGATNCDWCRRVDLRTEVAKFPGLAKPVKLLVFVVGS
jgi:hypothetical protein